MSMGAVEENTLFLKDTAKAKRQFGGNTNLTVSLYCSHCSMVNVD